MFRRFLAGPFFFEEMVFPIGRVFGSDSPPGTIFAMGRKSITFIRRSTRKIFYNQTNVNPYGSIDESDQQGNCFIIRYV